MAVTIRMPALSPTMTEGGIGKWLKREGDKVSAGDALAEIETDKATMELEAPEDGTLGKILQGEGSTGIAVNAPIAILLAEGEDERAIPKDVSPEATAPKAAEAPPAPAERPAAARAPEPPRPHGVQTTRPPGETRLFASPLARAMARTKGVELRVIEGSGPQGRVVARDVEAAKPLGPAVAATARAPLPAAGQVSFSEAPYVETPLSKMRKAIARRMWESKRDAPHFYLTVDCEIDELLKARAGMAASLARQAGKGRTAAPAPTINDFLIRALAQALRQVPEANVAFVDEKLRRYQRADVAVAVAIPDGLITPIVVDAGNKSLAQIAAEMRDLAARARDNTLAPHEYEGGTITLSNLGMFGIREFAAILNPPQACILAVGQGEKRAVVKDDALVPATVMTCTLAIDHRAVDGATGARFLAEFKQFVEEPLLMLL